MVNRAAWHACPDHPNSYSLASGICKRTIRVWRRCTKCDALDPMRTKDERDEDRKRREDREKRLDTGTPKDDFWRYHADGGLDGDCEGLVLYEQERCQLPLEVVIPPWLV